MLRYAAANRDGKKYERPDELDVFRTSAGGKYLGRIKLVYVEGDRSVGAVIRKTKNGIIQREDNVTTKL